MTKQPVSQSTMIANGFIDKLRGLGAEQYDLWLPETRALPEIVYNDEEIIGLVYGRYTESLTKETGRGVLVATDQRILLIDKKPLFMKSAVFTYDVVSAVRYIKAGIAGTVILQTRLGDIHVRTFNKRCATTFIKAIENTIVKNATAYL